MSRGNYGRRHDRVGQMNMSNNGQAMTVTKYNKYGDIQVTFDDGHVRDHMTYDAFQKNSIALMYDGRHDRKNAKLKEQKEGTTKIMANGLECTCIEYRNKWDADFLFEDGCIVAHTPWRNFEKQTLTSNRTKGDSKTMKNKAQRLYEVRTMNNGETLKITEYFHAKDITVINIRSGNTRKQQTYQNFKNGQINLQ